MSLKNSQERLTLLNSIIQELRNDNASLGSAERRKMADDLSEIYNYVSATSQKPSITNIIHAKSSHDARVKKEREVDREILNSHKQFVETSFAKADQYLKTIQLGAYAAFFTIWGFTRQWLDPKLSAIAAILMIISATTFVVYEIYKSTILALALKKHASISSSGLEEFIQNRFAKFVSEKSNVLSLAKSRATVWVICISTGFVSLAILVWQLLGVLSKHF